MAIASFGGRTLSSAKPETRARSKGTGMRVADPRVSNKARAPRLVPQYIHGFFNSWLLTASNTQTRAEDMGPAGPGETLPCLLPQDIQIQRKHVRRRDRCQCLRDLGDGRLSRGDSIANAITIDLMEHNAGVNVPSARRYGHACSSGY